MAAYSLLLAAVGTGVEAAISSPGASAYSHPDVLAVPIWLPGLYLHGAPVALALARAVGPARSVSDGRPRGAERLPRPA